MQLSNNWSSFTDFISGEEIRLTWLNFLLHEQISEVPGHNVIAASGSLKGMIEYK